MATANGDLETAPGVPAAGGARPRRFDPELVSCGLRGHALAGTDAAEIRPQDAIFVRPAGDGLRWHRCLRCDAWVMLPAPREPTRRHPPDRDEIELPLRGRPLRDKYVLRLIAVDRAFHFLTLGAISVAIFAFLSRRTQLQGEFYRVLVGLQGSAGGPTTDSHGTVLGDLRHLFSIKESSLTTLGYLTGGYALLEGIEAVGLWLRQRWAEYLTFVATTILLVPEVYELTHHVKPLKVVALVINVAVVVYLLFAKRLFGLRGGGRADAAEKARDSGWAALERVLPPHHDAALVPSARDAPPGTARC